MFQGLPVPAVDLSELTMGQPADQLMSTRIILVRHSIPRAREHLLGLIAEKATGLLKKEPREFVNSGIKIKAAPYLGPVLKDASGPIQWLHEAQLLSGPLEQLLFASPTLLATTDPDPARAASPSVGGTQQ